MYQRWVCSCFIASGYASTELEVRSSDLYLPRHRDLRGESDTVSLGECDRQGGYWSRRCIGAAPMGLFCAISHCTRAAIPEMRGTLPESAGKRSESTYATGTRYSRVDIATVYL